MWNLCAVDAQIMRAADCGLFVKKEYFLTVQRRVRFRTRRLCLPSGEQPDALGHQAQSEGDDEDRAGLEQIFVVPLRDECAQQTGQQHKDARARAEGEHAHRAACPRSGRGGEDPHRRQRAAWHQTGQPPDGERLAPEAAGRPLLARNSVTTGSTYTVRFSTQSESGME